MHIIGGNKNREEETGRKRKSDIALRYYVNVSESQTKEMSKENNDRRRKGKRRKKKRRGIKEKE